MFFEPQLWPRGVNHWVAQCVVCTCAGRFQILPTDGDGVMILSVVGAVYAGSVKAREWSVLLSVLAKQGITPPPAWQRATHNIMLVRDLS